MLALGPVVETFALEPLAADLAPPTPPSSPAEPPSPPSPAMRYVGFALLGVGAALAGLSTWQYVVAAEEAAASRDANATSPPPYRAWFFYTNSVNADRSLSASQLCARANTDVVSPYATDVRAFCARIETASAAAVGLLVPAAITLATGAVLLAVAPRSNAPVAVALLPRWGADGAGLTLTGSF
jgi:hypothetical protein